MNNILFCTLKKITAVTVAVIVIVTALCGCSGKKLKNDIVILYTGDVRGEVDSGMGYDGVAAYKKSVETKTPYVALVDCGDAFCEGSLAEASKGECIAEIMNFVGYDFAVLGDGDFNYGTENISALLKKSNAQYLATNVFYTGDYEDYLERTERYKIKEFDGVKVAFLGVTTPETVINGEPSYFMEGIDYVYEFCISDDGGRLAAHVQSSVDKCKELGADYVILLSHLGSSDEHSPYSVRELVAQTRGIDAVIDSHDCEKITGEFLKNTDGETVLISAPGEKLESIGELVISVDGEISSKLVSGYEDKDATVTEKIESLKKSYDE